MKINKEDYNSLLEMQGRLLSKFKEDCERKPEFTMEDITGRLCQNNRVRILNHPYTTAVSGVIR